MRSKKADPQGLNAPLQLPRYTARDGSSRIFRRCRTDVPRRSNSLWRYESGQSFAPTGSQNAARPCRVSAHFSRPDDRQDRGTTWRTRLVQRHERGLLGQRHEQPFPPGSATRPHLRYVTPGRSTPERREGGTAPSSRRTRCCLSEIFQISEATPPVSGSASNSPFLAKPVLSKNSKIAGSSGTVGCGGFDIVLLNAAYGLVIRAWGPAWPARAWEGALASRRRIYRAWRSVAADLVDQFIDIVLSHQLALLLLDPDAQQCHLRQDMLRISRSARRLPPLAPQVSQIGPSSGKPSPCRWITPSAFELADVGPAAIEVLR